jgi:hypothetical protein
LTSQQQSPRRARSTRSGGVVDVEELGTQRACARGRRRWEGKVPNQRLTAHSRDASVPAEYGPVESARGHDGTVTSVTSAEMPAPITVPTFTTTAITASTKCSKATTATITNKSSRVSLQLTHEIGGYIRRMRSCAPTENMKNTINTKVIWLSLSDFLTPSQARGLLTWARIRAPLPARLSPLKSKMIQHH